MGRAVFSPRASWADGLGAQNGPNVGDERRWYRIRRGQMRSNRRRKESQKMGLLWKSKRYD